ncbi:MAG: hypothetical protein QM705_12850 [Ancrocorticia sp.]
MHFRRINLLSAAISAALTLLTPSVASALPVAAPVSVMSASPTASSVEWTVVPTDANGADGRISLRHELDPGSTVSDAIEVRNTGSTEGVFKVYAGDGVVGANGAFDIAAGDPEDSGAWITVDGLDDGALTLAAGESRVLPVSIAVPGDAVPGDHPAGIVVALSQQGDGVTVTHRVGVRLHLQVTGNIAPALEITSSELTFEPSAVPFAQGTARMTYTLVNTGNVRTGAVISGHTQGPFGLGAASGVTDAPVELLPGDTVTQSMEIAALPLIRLSGELTVTPVSIGSDTTPLPEKVAVSLSDFAVSWSTVAVIILVLAAVVFVIVRRVRRPAPGASTSSTSSTDV